MSTFALPDLGEGLSEAEIVTWHVAEGDHVVTDQPLVAVETDKAVVEIPSPHSARILKLRGVPGDRIAVGDVLVEFEAIEARPDRGTVVGDIDDAAAAPPTATAAPKPTGKATPAVRALARRLGVDITVVQGMGPGGAVTRADVERAAKTLAAAGPAEPLRGVRRSMAERMTKARAEVVPATVTDDADVEAWPDGHAAADPGCRGGMPGRASPQRLVRWWADGASRARADRPRCRGRRRG